MLQIFRAKQRRKSESGSGGQIFFYIVYKVVLNLTTIKSIIGGHILGEISTYI